LIINIKLNEESGPMWFLKDQNHDVHLTYMNNGPVPVDFDLLSNSDKDYLYSSLTNGLIDVIDPSFEKVSEAYLYVKKEQERQVKEAEVSTPKIDPNIVSRAESDRKFLESEQRRREQNTKREDKYKLIIKSSLKAAKNAVSKENNIHNLLKILELEQANKNRKQLCGYIKTKVNSLKKKLSKEIEKGSRKTKLSEKEKKMIGEIEHSENEYLEFVLEGIEAGE